MSTATPIQRHVRFFSKRAVAQLSCEEVAGLTTSDLLGALEAADLPLLHDYGPERLAGYDRATLERLLYKARHCCQNQGY
ncbi:MAG TPA: hypothetical protein VHB77_06030 [Planctomycetaceae bacterium]|nr:hypothetical protein [Planctomycetaceae bacterium]